MPETRAPHPDLRSEPSYSCLRRTTCLRGYGKGNRACPQCGRLKLFNLEPRGVCWNAEYVQYSDVQHPEYPRSQDGSWALPSVVRPPRVDQAPLNDLLPVDFMDTPHGKSTKHDVILAGQADASTLPASIGVVMFFRLLKSLEQRRNTPGLLKLIRQVPSMINNTQALSLSSHSFSNDDPGEQPTKATSSSAAVAGPTKVGSPGGVVDAIMSTAEGLLTDAKHELSSEQQGDVLEAIVGLAVKEGSLISCLRAIKLLFCSAAADERSPIPGVGNYLRELERTKPSDLGGTALSECCEVGKLVLLSEVVWLVGATKPTVDSRSGKGNLDANCDSRASAVPSSLQGIDMLKVASTACHRIALTVDGELLTWSCRSAKAGQRCRCNAEANEPCLRAMNGCRRVPAWREASAGKSACLTSPAMLHRSAVCGERGHADSFIVRQVFAHRPNVTDVACGQEHILALLETGQVCSWGNGRNGRLGLGDTKDRLSACHVEAIQGIEIEAVFCGASHSMAVCSTGVCYAWGKNNSGQCGDTNVLGSDALIPRMIESLRHIPVAAMAGGWKHTLVLTRCGTMFSFGSGFKHKCMSTGPAAVLGISAAASAATADGTHNKQGGSSPTKVCDDALNSARVKTIACGWDHCLAATEDGALFTWGSGRHGQLGHGDTEPRYTPTRVAFFTSSAGLWVRSIVGGRTYSAVATVDGRVFKWGLNRAPRSSSGKERNRDEERRGGADRDLSEEDGTVALEALVPRQVAGIGMENPRALRLGEGEDFDSVLVELRSAAESHPPSLVHPSEHSTKALVSTLGLDVPDDPSCPVGRIETTVALLRHFERLAVPHTPRYAASDVDRRIYQAIRIGKRLRKRTWQKGTIPSARANREGDLSTTPGTDQEFGVTLSNSDSMDVSKHVPHVSLAEGQRTRQEALNIESRIPPSVAPFCVDTSVHTFRSFLDLIKAIRHRMSPVPVGIERADSSPLSKRKASKSQISTGAAGPKSCDKKIAAGGLSDLGALDNRVPEEIREDWNGFPVASRSIAMEVLRVTLKLLKTNLFHLVGIVAMRRSCRGNGDNVPRDATVEEKTISTKPRSSDRDYRDSSGIKARTATRKEIHTGQVEGGSDRLQSAGPQSRDDVAAVGTTHKNAPPVVQSVMREAWGQEGAPGAKECAHDMHGVIQELHAELHAILEEDIAYGDPGATNAALAVQAEAAEAFRVGFSLFYPSNPARVRVLNDIVRTVTAAGSPSPERNQRHGDKRESRRRAHHAKSHSKSRQRVRLASKLNGVLVRLAVEALTREKYAAGLVTGAFSHEGWGGIGLDGAGTATGESGERFDASALDAVMRSLLSHCAGDLHKRLWGEGVRDQAGENRSGISENGEATCPFSRLLLVLQTHVLAFWGGTEHDGAAIAARELSLAHASRLLEQSLQIFTRFLLTEGDQADVGAQDDRCHGDGHPQLDALRNSFVSLVPVLCTSVVALPTVGEELLTRAARLLPLVIPLTRAVGRFDRPRLRDAEVDAPVQSERSSLGWLTELEAALAVLSSDLVCGLIDVRATNLQRHVGVPSQANNGGGGGGGDGGGGGYHGDQSQNDEHGDDVIARLLGSSPFLAYSHENFDWSGLQDNIVAQRNSLAFVRAHEVIKFQESVTKEACGCSRPAQSQTSALGLASSNPTSSHQPPRQNVTSRGRRRASHDTATKLCPIDGSVYSNGLPGQLSPSSAPTKHQGPGGKATGEEGNGGNGGNGGVGNNRQLDRIVDEARAEGFIQDILCGQGAANALYLWMTIPPASHVPVLHATSLATQGQGWGSYQSLSATSVPSQQQQNDNSFRRRRSRALPSDIDAATRALVAVIIKGNRAVAEAATFARCRLDRASSPPRALRLVAAAAVEVREALAGLADCLETEKSAGRYTGGDPGDRRNEDGGMGGHETHDSLRNVSEETSAAGLSSTAAATLANIVRNCRFLLECTHHLPPIEVARKGNQMDTSIRRQRSASRSAVDNRQRHRELSQTLSRWAAGARNNVIDEGPVKLLERIVKLMAEGLVDEALSVAEAAPRPCLPSRSASLESLVAFAASPIPLGAVSARMGLHEISAKVRVAGFRLIHVIINETHVPAARRQIGARLARSLSTTGGGIDNSALCNGVGAGENPGRIGFRSAYFDLFRHVVHGAEKEDSTFKSQGGKAKTTDSSSSQMVFLQMLQSLASLLTPSILRYDPLVSSTSEYSRSWPRRQEPQTVEAINLFDNQGWPGRTGRASSCPAITRAEVSVSKAVIPADQESTPVVIAAISILGVVLSGQGDILSTEDWGPGSTHKNSGIHHAAWRALGVISMRVSPSSAPAWATHTTSGGHGFEPSRLGAGELERPPATRESWNATLATLRVIFDELTRARDWVEKLQQSRMAEELLLIATGALRLSADDPAASLWVQPNWILPELSKEDGKEIGALSFWIYRPLDTTDQQLSTRREKLGENVCSSSCRDKTYCTSRIKVFALLHEGRHPDKTRNEVFDLFVRIYSSQVLPREESGMHGSSDGGEDGCYVQVVLGRIKERSGGEINNRSELGDGKGGVFAATVRAADGTHEADEGEEAKNAGADESRNESVDFKTECFFSACSLPRGQWTHVYCTYSIKRGSIVDKRDATSRGGADNASGDVQSEVSIALNGSFAANHALPSSRTSGAKDAIAPQDRPPTHGEMEPGELDQYPTRKQDLTPLASEQWNGTPTVCDVWWHSRKASPRQVRQMAESGIPRHRKSAQRAAENYIARLVALAEDMVASSQRVAATLSSPRWRSLWLELMSVAGDRAKRSIVRLLRPLLCVSSQPASDDDEGTRATPTAPSYNPPASPTYENGVGDRAMVDSLCALLGQTLRPLFLCHPSSRGSEGGGGDRTWRQSSRLRQDSSMPSEIVMLLRSLVAEVPNRWRKHVFGALSDGLASAAKGEMCSLDVASGGSGTGLKEDDRAWTWLGAALAAAYLGGGHVEGPRLGATVLLVPSPECIPLSSSKAGKIGCQRESWNQNNEGLLNELLGGTCSPLDTGFVSEAAVKHTCRGTIVGWVRHKPEQLTTPPEGMLFVAVDDQHQEYLDDEDAESNRSPPKSYTRSQAAEDRCCADASWTSRIVAVQTQQVLFQEEIVEPVTPFLFQVALPSVLALLDLPFATTTRATSASSGEQQPPNSGVTPALVEPHRVVAAHLRCRLVRALGVQARHIGQAAAAVRKRVFGPILGLAAMPLASAVVLALGSEGAVAFGRRSEFAAVFLALRHQRTASEASLLSDLESASQIMWQRLISTGKGDDTERGSRCRPRPVGGHVKYRGGPALQVLGGEALVEGNRVTASSHFPTIYLSNVGIGAKRSGGRWYYEVTLLTGGLMQLGWAGPGFQCSPTRGQGVGDHMQSWAFDGFRQKRWCVSSALYGERWRAGDVVGVLLDASLQEMRFSMNGRDLGAAFEGADMQGLYPAASMNAGQAALFNFGHSPFLYAPTDSNRSPCQPVSGAVATDVVAHSHVAGSAELRDSSGVDEDRAEARRANGSSQDDTREVSPSAIRGRNAAAATGAGRSEIQVHASSGEGYGRGGESDDDSRLEFERQELVQNLIAMGFPVEWALRAAGRPGSVMSESAAAAWIIERLEIENTKMEEEMGDMDACEEDSTGGDSAYNDDTGGSEDGDVRNTGIGFTSEAAGVARRVEGRRVIAHEQGRNRRWHDMYSTVSRSFLPDSNGESPATAAVLPSGSLASSPIETAFLASAEAATMEETQQTPNGFTRVALSANKSDLQSLTLVVDTALTILYARAAAINVLMHIVTPSATNTCPSPRFGLATSDGSRLPTCTGEGSGELERTTAIEVAHGILEALAIPENQRRFQSFTKALVTWPVQSHLVGAEATLSVSGLSVKEPAAAGAMDHAVIRRNESMEDSRPGICPSCSAVAHPLGLYPGSCLLTTRRLFDALAASAKPWSEWKAWFSETTPSARRAEEGPSISSLQRSDSDLSRMATGESLPSPARLLALFIREAISVFEGRRSVDLGESLRADISATEDRGYDDWGARDGSCEPLSRRAAYSWALWVLGTLISLETGNREKSRATHTPGLDGQNASTEPVWVARGHSADTGDDSNSMLPQLVSARLPRAFSAILQSAAGSDLDETLQALAYSLCSSILDYYRQAAPSAFSIASPPGRSETAATADDTTDNTLSQHRLTPSAVPEDGYELPAQERSLARRFSSRLWSQASTPHLASDLLLESQLELLAQWELRRSTVDNKRRLRVRDAHRPRGNGWEQEEAKAGVDKPSPSDECFTSDRDSWDVATACFAGVEGEIDEYQTTHVRGSRAGARARRMGTGDSETSVTSTLPTPGLLGRSIPANHNSLLVEAVSATSVTVSWGGWVYSDDDPELQVAVGSSDGFAYPSTLEKVPRASHLAQALRTKLKYAASRRRLDGAGLVLKVRACGLWGSEPLRVAALDLDCRGCLKVNGLAADTRYFFQLEHLAASPSPPRATAAVDTSDDERSYFPSTTNSAGGSSADQLGADTTDGTSALTGLDGSGSGDAGGGGGSTCSEGCTTLLTDESRRQEGQPSDFASSTTAVAGRDHSLSTANRLWTSNRTDFQWLPTSGQYRVVDASEGCVAGRAVVASMSVATPPEIPFMLDAEGCGPNLRLTNSNLTVTNTGRKKWSTVRATRGFTCGVHRWNVRIDRCVSKNVFVGVMSSESRLNNYVGSDKLGWGFLANKAIWHDKSKVRSYGDLFREGDTIGVSLNMDLGTLRFARNGCDLGLAMQGLEGTLYPAFSMYNRSDRLTFMPPEDHAAPTATSAVGTAFGEKGERSPDGGEDVLYGTFSAECVVRRASKVVEVLGVLNHDGKFASPAGVELVDTLRSRLRQWSRGKQGRSLQSPRKFAPVRVGTFNQARRGSFGLGVGDRVLTADGHATVLGETRHSLWVEVETHSSSPASPFSRRFLRGARMWDSEVPAMRVPGETGGNRGHEATRPSHSPDIGGRKREITSWSRRIVRQIFCQPEKYVVIRQTSPEESAQQAGGATNDDGQASTAAADIVDLLCTDELRSVLSKWTPDMDEELGRHLASLADSMPAKSLQDLPFDALDKLPQPKDMFPSSSPLASSEVWVRATLLLYINDLVVPLLPLIDTGPGCRGPLSTLVFKCRHLFFRQAKLSLLNSNVVRPAQAAVSSEAELCTAYSTPSIDTISLIGVKSLPRFPSPVGNPAEIHYLPWIQTSREVQKSVFGQVARHFSSKYQFSEGAMAFLVELVDAPTLVDEADADSENLLLLDAPALYRGVFWQICAEVCSPPISMFIRQPVSQAGADDATRVICPAAPDTTATGTGSIGGAGNAPADHHCKAAITSAEKIADGSIPNPLFTSDGMSRVCMDPSRVALYRSFGFIVGLAVRAEISLPLAHLSTTWWMLVSNSLPVLGERAPRSASKSAGVKGMNCSRSLEEVDSSDIMGVSPSYRAIDGVLASLQRLEETGLAHDEIEEILADGRFVAPLSNGHVTELLPRGLSRPVGIQNLGEYVTLLARLRASGYAPQAAAFRAGLEAALPRGVLSLLTWREMKGLVCGRASSETTASK